MSLQGSFIHNIDPIIVSVFGVHLWWYGLSYSLGFLNAHMFVSRRRAQLGISPRAVYNLSLLLACGVLLGGRLVEVVFYEWPFYSEHLLLIAAYWLGGMATHGLLIGGLIGVWIFCRLHAKSFLSMTDALSIPAAMILGFGRIGNFIDGQIVGSLSSAWWAVKFPDADGFRHPVVLYDGLKNFLIIPILIYVGRRGVPRGVVTGTFLFLYAFLRIFVDVFREYPTTFLGLATGQALNLFMSAVGLALIFIQLRRKRIASTAQNTLASVSNETPQFAGIGWRRTMFIALLLFSLIIPSDWTQDIPQRYGHRHAGLNYSIIYPKIQTAPESPHPTPKSSEIEE